MLEYVNHYLSGIIVPCLLIGAGLFYCVKLRAFHILRPAYVVRGLRQEKGHGGVSSAKAVTLALAGTLGVGNIVGVSSAIHLGGFGAVMWMWLSALVAMVLKYAEIVLAMRYKRDGNGGSAMNYIKALFSSPKLKRLGEVLAAVFALLFLLTAFTMGSMLQANSIADALSGVVGLPKVYTGAVIAVVIFFFIRSGVSSITALTELLVPLMSVGYVVMSMVVIIKNGSHLSTAFYQIFTSAFSVSALASGVGGFAFTRAVRYGVMRGLVSNEAGCGTAPTAHSIAENVSPARQGMWGILEVFIDTVVLCTMTALVVILEYGEAARYGGNYMMMTIAAFAATLGSYAEYFLCVAVLCFGFATILCWAHYGLTCARYFKDSRSTKRIFAVAYCACILLGAIASSELAWQLSDFAMGAMTVINLAVICAMWRDVKYETDIYLK